MKDKIINALIWLAIIGIVIFWTWFLEWMSPGTPFQAFFSSLIVLTPITILIIIAIRKIIWRYDNGVDLFATLETDPEEVKARMLVVMQFGHEHGMVGALKEFNDIFRNYPQWQLQNWEVFRAWYKNEIDYMLLYPEIYHLTMKETGESYDKDSDPLYDPKAPDWALYDRDHTHDFDEDDEDFCFESGAHPGCRRMTTGEALSFGVGLGAGLELFGDNQAGCNGGDSCDGGSLCS